MVDLGISFAYLVATTAGLTAVYFINRVSPDLNPIVKFFVLPILVIYVALKFLQFVFPHINRFGRESKNYLEMKSLGEINNMGYIQIFPVFFAVLVIFIILLYAGAF